MACDYYKFTWVTNPPNLCRKLTLTFHISAVFPFLVYCPPIGCQFRICNINRLIIAHNKVFSPRNNILFLTHSILIFDAVFDFLEGRRELGQEDAATECLATQFLATECLGDRVPMATESPMVIECLVPRNQFKSNRKVVASYCRPSGGA